MIDDRSIQVALQKSGHYAGDIDGIFGPKSKKAVQAALLDADITELSSWSDARTKIAYQQFMMNSLNIPAGIVDGLIGPQTRYALEVWQNRARDSEVDDKQISHMRNDWPRQKDVPDFFGEVGKNQKRVQIPFPMKLAWDKKTTINSFLVHEKVHASVERIFLRTLQHYGQHELTRMHLDSFGGSLNVRKMKGGSKYSMHSWGIAIDIDPTHNKYRWGRDKAWLARKHYRDFLGFWEDEGWVSLGRERNFDWMHFQAARL